MSTSTERIRGWKTIDVSAFRKRYTLHAPPVGEGAFGVVYKAWDRKQKKTVAVKILTQVDDRIEDEVNILKEISKGECNANAACFHKRFAVKGVDGVDFVIVTEFIDGVPLDEYVRKNPAVVHDGRLEALFDSAVRGLEHIHDRGVAHLDIKPENIMVRQAPGPLQAVIIDLGLGCMGKKCARNRGDGTLTFLSPERIYREFMKEDNDRELTLVYFQRGDRWALSAAFVEALGPILPPVESEKQLKVDTARVCNLNERVATGLNRRLIPTNNLLFLQRIMDPLRQEQQFVERKCPGGGQPTWGGPIITPRYKA